MEKMLIEEFHQSMHRVKRRNTSTYKMLIKDGQERRDLEKNHSWKERFFASLTETDGKQTKWKLEKENEI